MSNLSKLTDKAILTWYDNHDFSNVKIPIKILGNKNLSSYAIRLYCQIKWDYDATGICVWSIRQMAENCNMSKLHIYRAQCELLSHKLIKIDDCYGADSYTPIS